ncbi:MAG TPA: cupin domain-containing protein [Usitatibacter sp.]|nr:cupin domain-containing protein [Usitatibacter sp.]
MNARILAVLAACAATLAFAQAPAIKRTVLQRTDVGPDKEAILGLAEISDGGATGRHTHPGIETGYVLQGTTVLTLDGEAPRTLHAGDSYSIPAGRVHDARAEGGTARVIATYVVEKGKPLASPAK